MDSLSFHRYDVFLKRLFYYITSFCFCQHFFEIFLKFFISFCCLHSRGNKQKFLVFKSRFASFKNPKSQDISQCLWQKRYEFPMPSSKLNPHEIYIFLRFSVRSLEECLYIISHFLPCVNTFFRDFYVLGCCIYFLS